MRNCPSCSIIARMAVRALPAIGLVVGITSAALAGGPKTGFDALSYTVLVQPSLMLTDGDDIFFFDSLIGSQEEATDPRVAGDAVAYASGVIYDPVLFTMGPFYLWGSERVENEGGAWECWTRMGSEYVDGDIFGWFVRVGVGTGGYEGLVARWEGAVINPVPGEPMELHGYIVEGGGGLQERPFRSRACRVDRMTLRPSAVIFPPAEDPTNPEVRVIAVLESLEEQVRGTHIGNSSNYTMGLIDTSSGMLRMMGALTTANKDVIDWVASGLQTSETEVSIDVHWTGGTGRFAEATGGWSASGPAPTTEPTDDPLVFIDRLCYSTRGTIRY